MIFWHTGDARQVLATIPDQSVHCVVTSPPYWSLRDYGITTEQGAIGQEETFDQWLAALLDVFAGVHRVLRDDGVLWVNMGDAYVATGKQRKQLMGQPWRFALALQDAGWWLRSDIIWAKPNPVTGAAIDRPVVAHEYIFLLAKGPTYFYDAESIREPHVASRSAMPGKWYEHTSKATDTGINRGFGKAGARHTAGNPHGRNKRTVWHMPVHGFKDAHFATFPPELSRICLLAGTSRWGACALCGAPFKRTLEPVETGETQRTPASWDTGAGGHGTIHRDGRAIATDVRPVTFNETIGWERTCACPPQADGKYGVVPCVALDPFGGSGTVALEARSLGLDMHNIEINPEYLSLSQRRLRDEQPLLTTPDPADMPADEVWEQVPLFSVGGQHVRRDSTHGG